MRRVTAVWVGATIFAAAVPLHAARLVPLEDFATGADPAALPGSHQQTPVVGLRPDGAVLVWNEPKKGLVAHFFDTTGAAKGAEVVLAANDALPRAKCSSPTCANSTSRRWSCAPTAPS